MVTSQNPPVGALASLLSIIETTPANNERVVDLLQASLVCVEAMNLKETPNKGKISEKLLSLTQEHSSKGSLNERVIGDLKKLCGVAEGDRQT